MTSTTRGVQRTNGDKALFASQDPIRSLEEDRKAQGDKAVAVQRMCTSMRVISTGKRVCRRAKTLVPILIKGVGVNIGFKSLRAKNLMFKAALGKLWPKKIELRFVRSARLWLANPRTSIGNASQRWARCGWAAQAAMHEYAPRSGAAVIMDVSLTVTRCQNVFATEVKAFADVEAPRVRVIVRAHA